MQHTTSLVNRLFGFLLRFATLLRQAHGHLWLGTGASFVCRVRSTIHASRQVASPVLLRTAIGS